MNQSDSLVGGLLSFPDNFVVSEIESGEDDKSGDDSTNMYSAAPDKIGQWEVSRKDHEGSVIVTFKDIDLMINEVKKNLLGWTLEFDGKLEKFETAEQMRDRVFELLK
jgi:hypothetical protein